MKPVVMPDHWFPGAARRTIGGENDTEPAEYAVLPDPNYGKKVTTLVRLDPEEAAQIADSGYLVLTMYGGELPWSIQGTPDPFEGGD